jgi:TrmH family RNA methyltransferase
MKCNLRLAWRKLGGFCKICGSMHCLWVFVLLENIRVVLVNTSHPGNIGGAVRAMKNMGLSQLVLVDPQDFPSAEAVARASGAADILDGAQVVGTLEEALVGCRVVLGTSARDRHIPWPMLEPRECGVVACEQAQQGAQVALVFGREYAGLTNEELQRCHFHVHIPSDPAFSSLNLAAAVQVLAYEVRMAWLAAGELPLRPEAVVEQDDEPVTADELESFYTHLEQALIEIKFLDPVRPRRLMSRLRRLYGRIQVTRSELNLLRGSLSAFQGRKFQRREKE